MIGWLIGSAERMPEALVARYPELGAIRLRRGGLPPRVSGWLIGQASVAAVTLWSTVWLGRAARLDAELLLHESRHVFHFRQSWAFPFLYLWETLRRGYHMNRFEVDARDYAERRMRGANPP